MRRYAVKTLMILSTAVLFVGCDNNWDKKPVNNVPPSENPNPTDSTNPDNQ